MAVAFCALAETVLIAGHVLSINDEERSFTICTRSGDQIEVFVRVTTNFEVLRNLCNSLRDRFIDSHNGGGQFHLDPVLRKLHTYLSEDALVFVRGIHQEASERERFEARVIYLLRSSTGARYVFEETHWWLEQIQRLADSWLDELFDEQREYTVTDFSKFYRTNLNITGHLSEHDPNLQECATLSRLIYGLSSAYLLTGARRYYQAAKAAVDYQRQAFRALTSDGRHLFWAFGRRKTRAGERVIFPSENSDDAGAIPLYEQIYALAGLAQYYRITADWQVLEDIRRTLNAFDDFFRDSGQRDLPGHGGYFSHLDPITHRPDNPSLGQNAARKNWNSIGDHIPAYLVNLVLALDPLPLGPGRAGFQQLRERSLAMLDDVINLIIEKFPDEKSDYVNERFFADWTPDHEYGWQQNRAIVGHNLKIAWNLVRCAFNLRFRANQARDRGRSHDADALEHQANRCLELAIRLGDTMAKVGVDSLRGGVFDAVERAPSNGLPVEFAWGSTKDFWQQEQGVLAYLLLYAVGGRREHLELARECMAFWNLFFLDRDRQGIFFRTSECGLPEIQGVYGQKGSHAMAGYHSFELNYFAHLYLRSYVESDEEDRRFCLYFHVRRDRKQQSVNVLPDFVPPNRVEITRVRANGLDRTEELWPESADDFQIRLEDIEPNQADGSIDLTVEYSIH